MPEYLRSSTAVVNGRGLAHRNLTVSEKLMMAVGMHDGSTAVSHFSYEQIADMLDLPVHLVAKTLRHLKPIDAPVQPKPPVNDNAALREELAALTTMVQAIVQDFGIKPFPVPKAATNGNSTHV